MPLTCHVLMNTIDRLHSHPHITTPQRATYLHFKLKPVQRPHRGRMQEGAKRRRGELYQEFVTAGNRLGDRLSSAAKFEDHGVSRRVTVVDDHVILHVIAVVPNFQLPRARRPVQGRLAPEISRVGLVIVKPFGEKGKEESLARRGLFICVYERMCVED